MRRRLLVVLSVVIAAGTLVVGTTAATAGASTASKITKCVPKTAGKGIQKALVAFLTGATGADKVALVDVAADQRDALAAAVDASGAAAEAQGLALPVTAAKTKATCSGKKAATFTYDLVNKDTGDPLLPGQAGDAVLKKGKWLLSAVFVCDLGDQNPAGAGAISTQCYTAIGEEDPTP